MPGFPKGTRRNWYSQMLCGRGPMSMESFILNNRQIAGSALFLAETCVPQ